MATNPDNRRYANANLPKQRKLQFSLRMLVVLTTLLCAYFACWRATKLNGVDDVSQWLTAENDGVTVRAGAQAPLLLVYDIHRIRASSAGKQIIRQRRCFFWYFGWIAELPIANETARDLK